MTNKEKAKIWAKIAKEIEQKGPSALEACGLCSIGLQNGLSEGDTYGQYDYDDTPLSGVQFLLGSSGGSTGYLWPKDEEGAQHRAMAAQLIACYLNDEPDEVF